jgi:hypothetical protein
VVLLADCLGVFQSREQVQWARLWFYSKPEYRGRYTIRTFSWARFVPATERKHEHTLMPMIQQAKGSATPVNRTYIRTVPKVGCKIEVE